MAGLSLGEHSYILFFRGKGGESLCIDAQQFPCSCHQDKECFGRRINHSRKCFNVHPQRFTMALPSGPAETILFLATRDIKVNEEILYDYGVTRKSFQGEGADLDWLEA